MDVRPLGSATEFLRATESLRAREPVMTNLLGSVATAVAAGAIYDSETWLVVVDEGEVVGCALRTAPWPLLLSPMSDEAATAIGRYVAERHGDIRMASGPRAVAFATSSAMGMKASVRMSDIVRVLRTLAPAPPCDGRARLAVGSDLELLLGWFAHFNEEADLPVAPDPDRLSLSVSHGHLWIWEEESGVPVAMGGHAPTVETPGGTVGRIGPVYTIPSRRRRGYGAAITHAVTTILLEHCDQVMLFADAANPGSNSIYEQLGFAVAGEIVELELVAP